MWKYRGHKRAKAFPARIELSRKRHCLRERFIGSMLICAGETKHIQRACCQTPKALNGIAQGAQLLGTLGKVSNPQEPRMGFHKTTTDCYKVIVVWEAFCRTLSGFFVLVVTIPGCASRYPGLSYEAPSVLSILASYTQNDIEPLYFSGRAVVIPARHSNPTSYVMRGAMRSSYVFFLPQQLPPILRFLC